MIEKVQEWKDIQNNDIVLWKFSCQKSADNILLVGRFHGDEPEGEFILEQMLNLLRSKSYTSAYNIYILPCLNPSGKQLFSRANINKIDLNRNYPTKNFSPHSTNPHMKEGLSAGYPASEVETKIMMEIIEKHNFKKILTIHSDLHLIDYDGPAKYIAEVFAANCGYKLVDNIGYPTNGSFGTWAGQEKQIPVITVETWGAKDNKDMLRIWEELQKAIFNFCQISQI